MKLNRIIFSAFVFFISNNLFSKSIILRENETKAIYKKDLEGGLFLHLDSLIMAKGSWLGICIGVVLATFVSLIIASHLSDKLKKFPHPEKIGGVVIIIIGVLLALKIL